MKCFLLGCLAASTLFAASPVSLPDGSAPAWSQPTVVLTTTRAVLDLSGPWQFTPGTFTDQAAPAGEWGWIRVPGNWMAERNNPILARSATGDWENGVRGKWGQGANLDKMPVKSPFSKHHREKPAFWRAAWPSFSPD